ncbi:hypothetical protein [Pseudomonas sp. H9]|uniref:hypothetical protein n=1 Tax=Pseudomonas sp. H9 TaxID=483968 RepID=UPI0010576EB2|nr:hypothetical protein [Pseudomonas sp. H9]TDF83832.1 hypothetical protein E1573_08725 [Pseudomonas sp. H9]
MKPTGTWFKRTPLLSATSVALAASLFAIASAAQAQPESPPRNPFLADSNYSVVHGNPAQTDSTVDAGPVDSSRQLRPEELRYHDLGMFNLLYLVSGKYADGKRVIWTNGSQFMTKLDYDSFNVISSLRMPGTDHNDHLAHENWLKVFDSNADLQTKLAAARQSGIPAASGVYTLLDKDNQYVVGGNGFVRIYGDQIPGDRQSGVVVRAEWLQPKEITGTFMGMNMTYDGRIILATTDGYLVALSRDFKDVQSIRLPGATEEIPKQPKGVFWVRNGFAIDEKGGIYIASQNHLHKVVWNGERFSTQEKDGAWSEPYSNSLGRGTGATPTLVGFGNDPDKLVALTDGDKLMNVVAFWRDAIPESWKQLDGTPSRRIAGMLPANFGDPDLQAAQSEQSLATSGYGMFVVNNEPRNVPEAILNAPREKLLFIGYLSYLKEHAPVGGQKFEWDPKRKTLTSAWANREISSPNSVPFVSTGSNMVYLSGARNDQWTLEAIDWTTGKSAFHYTLGGARFNSFYSQPQVDDQGRVMVSALYGALRIQPKK